MPAEVILSTDDTFDIWCLDSCSWVLCEFIIHMGKCMYSSYRWGSVRIYGDAKNAKTQRTAPTSICTAMQRSALAAK